METFDVRGARVSGLVRRAGPTAWVAIWIGAIGLAVLIHLAFLVAWPDNFIHEDSAAYLDEARSILTGHYVDDPGRRPYGVAFFLVLLSKVFSPNILVFVIAQHVMSILAAISIAAVVRMAGGPRFFSLLAFLLSALYGRTVHYDNTVGAETISVFLTSLAGLITAGAVFRKWPPLLCVVGLGLSLGWLMLCRSAAVGVAAVLLIWLLIYWKGAVIRRVGMPLLAGAIATAVYLTPATVNWFIGKPPSAGEGTAVMAFVVGYSGDFEHGVHLDRKAGARKLVEQKRAADSPLGWGPDYQWPFQALGRMSRPSDSPAEFESVVRDIFVETLTTPSTLWRHLSKHFAREIYFLLFDGNDPARVAPSPEGYEPFVKRDVFPIFKSPTGIKPRTLVHDYYAPPHALSWLLPTPDRLQARLDRLLSFGYSPRPDRAPLCCRLSISSEYDHAPGPIRWLSAATLMLAIILMAGRVAGWSGFVRPLPQNLVAAGVLMFALAFINAAFPAFLIYGLNRYAYYVVPFLAGAVSTFSGALVGWVTLPASKPIQPSVYELR